MEYTEEQTRQTVTVDEYASATGLTVNQVHYQLRSNRLPFITSGRNGKIVIPKSWLSKEIDFKAIRPLDLSETLHADMVADFLGYSYGTLRKYCAENPSALVTFPLGRSFGVTTESLYRLLGHPISLWPEIPFNPVI